MTMGHAQNKARPLRHHSDRMRMDVHQKTAVRVYLTTHVFFY